MRNIGVCAVVALASAANIEARGDKLELLRAAQKTNQGRYAEGRVHVIYRDGQIGDLTTHNYGECDLAWSGTRVYTRVSKRKLASREATPKTPCYDHEEWIVDAARSILLAPHSG